MSASDFAKISLNDKQIAECVKKPKLAVLLKSVIDESTQTDADRTRGSLLLSLAQTSLKNENLLSTHRAHIARSIGAGDISSATQLDAAVDYCTSIGSSDIDPQVFDAQAGVGQIVTPDAVAAIVGEYMTKEHATIVKERYRQQPVAMKEIRQDTRLKWANMADLKVAVDASFLRILGPKDERDAPQKKKKASEPTAGIKHQAAQAPSSADLKTMFTSGFLGQLHKVGENPQSSVELREKHMHATNGRVQTRFPPEPNGYLHIGHSKAITVNFGYARAHDGVCYLRFDDTNPEREEEKYFISIEAMIRWLGFQPYKITYSSDYFQELYDLAEKLIDRGKAYTCTCTDEEIKQNRGGEERGPRVACIHREQPKSQTLREFRDMRSGVYRPKEIVLRMKQDLEDGNPQMWDLIAYRVLNTPHHRTGAFWKIYPTYDFTHCLVDSMENITHSLCTTEFQQSRVSYEWLCDAVGVYKPAQREYGRLNLQGTVMSKRKIEQLVSRGYVRDWNDPRLYTLVALRRRGIPPGAILRFVEELGVTTNMTSILTVKFENVVRNFLEFTVPRLMMVLDPIKVILQNVPDDYEELCTIPFSPRDSSMGEHIVPFTKVFYIDRSDFRLEASKDFFRLTPGTPVGLLKAKHTIRVAKYEADPTGIVSTIYAHYENDTEFIKPKTYIQWVPHSTSYKSPVRLAEVRVHHQLFHSDDPSSHPQGFLADVDADSEQIIRGALIEPGYWELARNGPWPKVSKEQGNDDKNAPESVRFQALRVGYFCADSDTTSDQLILNRIVSLKEDTTKKVIG